MNRFFTGALIVITLAECTSRQENGARLKTGVWRAVIQMQAQELPFNFEVTRDAAGGYDIYLLNADERLLLDEVAVNDDSVNIGLHIFDANIKARVSGDSLQGLFIKNYTADYKLPFLAVHGLQYRFEENDTVKNTADFSGKYEVTFLHEGDTTKAIGVFRQRENRVTGTFLTPTGDYRYLEGNAEGDKLFLSTFDGNHAYLFKGRMENGGAVTGDFFSGITWHETWVAQKNEKAALPDASSLTYLKDGYETISFTFPDVDGKPVSLDDEKYKGKVVILQLLGTWCPNCMDETKFLSPWYEENKDRGIEVIGLAYERKPDFDYASTRVRKMVDKMDVKYDVLIAGTDDKEQASKTLPMLNGVMAFPTTIFIGKDGKVKNIHTGFTGPGTRQYYDQFIQEFNETVNAILKEGFTAEINNK